MFLASENIAFELETTLTSDTKKDVDVRAHIGREGPIHIEIQWLSPSDRSERGAAIATAYGKAYSIDYENEKWRIKGKVFTKVPKFTRSDVTFVALDCTSSPELGGDRYSVVEEAIVEAYTGRNLQGEETPYSNSDIDKAIRRYVDGIIWYELTPGNKFIPNKRGLCLNPNSSHRGNASISHFAGLWKSSTGMANFAS